MIIWSYNLVSVARQAVAGRRYPHQLAWATAFGLLLGIVPHGNLLAVSLLLVVLSLKLNHAMAALTAGATSVLLAAQLDPLAHRLGATVLNHQAVRPVAMTAWELPLIPWTDLNNTVVMGSFVIGVVALLPVFLITYPVFRFLSRSASDSAPTITSTDPPARGQGGGSSAHQVILVDRGHARVPPPRGTSPTGRPAGTESPPESEGEVGCWPPLAVETRIDVIRMKDHRSATPEEAQSEANPESKTADTQPMDEALNYLLRQLRDSQQRSAA